jgi:hypothetical protein
MGRLSGAALGGGRFRPTPDADHWKMAVARSILLVAIHSRTAGGADSTARLEMQPRNLQQAHSLRPRYRVPRQRGSGSPYSRFVLFDVDHRFRIKGAG